MTSPLIFFFKLFLFFFALKTYPLMKGVIHMLKRVHQMNEEEKKQFVDIVG